MNGLLFLLKMSPKMTENDDDEQFCNIKEELPDKGEISVCHNNPSLYNKWLFFEGLAKPGFDL